MKKTILYFLDFLAFSIFLFSHIFPIKQTLLPLADTLFSQILQIFLYFVSVKNILHLIIFQLPQDMLVGDLLMINIAQQHTEIRWHLMVTDIPLMKVRYLEEHKTNNSVQKQHNETIHDYQRQRKKCMNFSDRNAIYVNT